MPRSPWSATDFRRQLQFIIIVALPIMVAQIFDALAVYSNTYFAARVGENALAAHSLVISLFFLVGTLSWGLMSSGSIIIAHCYGSNKHAAINRTVAQLALIGVLTSAPFFLIFWHLPSLFLILGINKSVVALTVSYCHILAVSTILHNLAFVLFQLIIGTGKTRALLWISVVMLVVVTSVKYALIYGVWGFPKIGLPGLGVGIATSFVIYLIVGLLYVFCHKDLRGYVYTSYSGWYQRDEIFDLLRLGWPIMLSYFIEFALFSVMALLIGRMSAAKLAAFQISTQYLGLFAMVSFAVSQAGTVCVGQNLGAGNPDAARYTGIATFVLGFALQLIAVISIFLFSGQLVAIDIGHHFADPHVFRFALEYLSFAAIFLLIDSIRLQALGVLRAYKDTRYPLWVSLGCFWCVGQPIGYTLTYVFGMHVAGLWLGLLVGLVLSNIILIRRLSKHF